MSLNLQSFVITFRAAGLFPEAWLCLRGFNTHFGRKRMQGLHSFICFLKEALHFRKEFFKTEWDSLKLKEEG